MPQQDPSLKNINLKVPPEEHARMAAVAQSEFTPITSLLRRLFKQYADQHYPVAVAKPLTPKEQAIADYHAWAASPPQDLHTWDLDRCNRERDIHLEVYRKRAGNASVSDMPMPDWLRQQSLNNVPANSRAPAPSLNTAQFASSPYATWTLPALQAQYLQVLTTDAPLDPALRHWLDTREAEES